MKINLMMIFMVIYLILMASVDYIIIKGLKIFFQALMNKIVDALCLML